MIGMRKAVLYFKPTFVFALSVLLLSSCSNDEDEDIGNWVDRSEFDGTPRSGISGFVIDNIGYMGVGYDGDDYLNSFWSYDIEGDYWSQKADFPGAARNAAVGFQVDGTGYIGSGYDGVDELGDFYGYDPSTNTWTQIASLPDGTVRRSALAFGINGYGYFGTGYDGENDKKDFWKYNPSTDIWVELEGFGGSKRRAATTFAINGTVYMGTGVSNGVYIEDFWAFDPSTESWSKLTDIDEEDDYEVERSNAVGFELNGYGYIACGERNGATNSVWEYDPSSDTWEERTGFEGSTRQDAIAFSNSSRAFIGLGRTGTLYLDDIDEFFPFDEYDDED
ncbi:Galactose oxidase, central domain [Flagellimonas zhangzhouensis]|uniref:Galactose oxidase, central domain n=2 Tax=Flagellimonas zhangzhouensis TaxID=1073328 RepID=A0A1H2YAW1_9FLAO|nr:Galactose oxidase, central domain [Allomuricauda zhangzhouensis]SDX01978.1 Galactose oxidase, central domain [Allomuricauda zhangzhouensis]